MKTSKSQESGLNKIRSFFEIKRPTKSTSSLLVSRQSSISNTDEDEPEKFTGNKMFIRNHAHRTSSRKNRFKKVTNQTESETKGAVKDICRLYENLASEENKVVETKKPEDISSTNYLSLNYDSDKNNEQLLKDIAYREAKIEELRNIDDIEEISQRFIQKRIAKISLELTELYKQTEVRRRNHVGGNKCLKKIVSFVEAENEEDEENTKSVINELDLTIDKTKAQDSVSENMTRFRDIADKEAKIEELKNNEILVQNRMARITSELNELYAQTKVKRRKNVSERKQLREKKIASFAEAENENDAEEYRKSLIKQMDLEIANMKAEGFMDADENTIDENQDNYNHTEAIDENSQTQNCDIPFVAENTFLNEIRYKDNYTLDETLRNSDDSQHTIQDGKFEVETSTPVELFTKIDGDDDDEFGSSFDKIQDGIIVVFETYNDEGRELIAIEIEINRRTINPSSNIQLPIEESQMVFYQEDNDTYKLLHDTVEDNFGTEVNYQEKKISNRKDTEENNPVPTNEDTPAHQYFVFSPPPSNRSTVYSTVSRDSSTRSTVYSSTSRDSSFFDEDDEGIVMGRNNDDVIYSNVRRETFSDNNGVVRIERVVCPDESSHHPGQSAEDDNVRSPVSRSNSTTPARQLEFIMAEIKTTERKYVEDLGKIIKNYKPYIENHTPLHLIGRTGYLFGNIEKIYRKQMKFLEALEKSGDYIYGVVRCFIDHRSLFELYQYYFRNKPKADIMIKNFHATIKEMQDKFKERLDLSAYLLTPVQRLGKYILFLENIEKQLFKLDQPTEIVQEALNMIRSEMSKGNDAVAVESIENSPISKLDYGSFKMREQFSISKPKKMEAMVFLFENVLVFASNDQKSMDTFNYIDSIKMNDLRIATFDDYTIHLTDYTNSKRRKNPARYTYVLDAKIEKIWNLWKTSIEDALWKQLFAVKESVNSAPRRFKKNGVGRRTKSTGSSIFYVV